MRREEAAPVTTLQERSPQYRELFGWDVDESGALLLGRGIVGVVVQSNVADAVALTLAEYDSLGPILDLGGAVGWVFLADPNELVLAQQALPAGIAVLNCPHAVPLPMPGALPNQAPRWIRPPDVRSRWLPTLSAVLVAVAASRPRRPSTAPAVDPARHVHARATPATRCRQP